MIEITERCRCGAHLGLFEAHGRWCCTCTQRCYDPSVEDPSPIESLYGRGETPEDALDDYLTTREAFDLEPAYAPTALASFVVPRHPGSFRVVTESFATLAEAEPFAEAFRADTCRMLPPSPIFFDPTPTPIQKAANDHG